jgi:hypothetical protein
MARKGDWLQTFTGRQFWPLDPRAEDVELEDIIHSLAQQVRYAGHCPGPYTIAQHSVLVSRRAEALTIPGDDRAEVALWGLLHDASGAYVVDVPRPLKQFLPSYREIEDGVMRAICARFELPGVTPPEVKRADRELLATEAREFFPVDRRPAEWTLPWRPLPDQIAVWGRHEAEVLFRERWLQVLAMRRTA